LVIEGLEGQEWFGSIEFTDNLSEEEVKVEIIKRLGAKPYPKIMFMKI